MGSGFGRVEKEALRTRVRHSARKRLILANCSNAFNAVNDIINSSGMTELTQNSVEVTYFSQHIFPSTSCAKLATPITPAWQSLCLRRGMCKPWKISSFWGASVLPSQTGGVVRASIRSDTYALSSAVDVFGGEGVEQLARMRRVCGTSSRPTLSPPASGCSELNTLIGKWT